MDEERPGAPGGQPADNTNTFKTPEQAAAQDASAETMPDAEPTSDSSGQGDKMAGKRQSRWQRFNKFNWPPGKKEWLSFIIIALLVGGGVYGWIRLHDKPATVKPIPKVAPGKPTVPSTLTGLPVDPSVNQRTVTGVMIENSPQARPQSGLGEAGVVFEAIAEAGITRFLALYQDTAPEDIGPVRSARPYYEQWALGFDAAYAHVGGSPEALAKIKEWGVRDLDQFQNSGAYYRVRSRPAPHNVYTSIAALSQAEVEKGYDTSKYTGFDRKMKAFRKKGQAITAKSINLALSGPTYNAHYYYDAASNSYTRSQAGAPHIDANNNQPIKPTVVIAMVTPYSLKSNGYHSDYGVIGSGQVYIFQDGGVIIGQWAKESNASQIRFTDDKGQPIKLNPGRTWLTAVTGADRVSYAP